MRGMLRRVAFLIDVSEAGANGTAPDGGAK
jgi:hypothetical protein